MFVKRVELEWKGSKTVIGGGDGLIVETNTATGENVCLGRQSGQLGNNFQFEV